MSALLSGCDKAPDTNTPEDAEALEALETMIVGTPTSQGEQESFGATTGKASKTQEAETIEWIDLMPKEDLEALANPPESVGAIQDGSEQDTITSQLKNTPNTQAQAQQKLSPEEQRYQQALVSTNVVPSMANKKVRIPGFVVPIAFNDKEQITEFFLVPFFGACLHVPAPPPNQIIFVHYPKGFRVEHLFDPIWVTGQLTISMTENDVASSAYTMRMEKYENYAYRG